MHLLGFSRLMDGAFRKGKFYDAIYFVCSCGVIGFGHGDGPGKRVSGRDAPCVQLQRRCSFHLPLRVIFSMPAGFTRKWTRFYSYSSNVGTLDGDCM